MACAMLSQRWALLTPPMKAFACASIRAMPIYGVGALVSPLIATRIASTTPHWNYFFCILVGCASINVALLGYAFRKGMGSPLPGARDRAGTDLHKTITNKTVIIMSAFFFLYVGTEVTAGGWVVEFLIRERGGEAKDVGYVASGFWGGLTAGRVLLGDLTFRLGERRMVFLYLVLAVVVQLIFWFVPNIIANAVCPPPPPKACVIN